MRSLKLLILPFLLVFSFAAFTDTGAATTPGILDGIVDFVLGNFEKLGPTVQTIVLLVLLIVAVATHVAPYTATTRDDFLIVHKNAILEFVKKFFAIVAGNYGKAKNHTKVIEEKQRLKSTRT